VTVDAHVRCAAAAGWEQHVVVGVPEAESTPSVGGLAPQHVSPLTFGSPPLDFPVPGMSDVMPYPSTRFSSMTPVQLEAYRKAWSSQLSGVIGEVRPDLIHSHHLWIVSSLLKDVAPETPVVTQCHATGLRQMRLCPHLAEAVRAGCARNDHFLALHAGDARTIAKELELPDDRVHVVGAGYREDVFHPCSGQTRSPRIAYVGKYSSAKGLPWLLDAFERLASQRPGLELHVAGSGSGSEADNLRARMQAMAPTVILHGAMSQEELADMLRTCRVFVLPSLYEGVPLVVVEALACGCRPVATELPGVRDELAPHLGDALIRVPPPRLEGVDTPDARDLPWFVDALYRAMDQALDEPFDVSPDRAGLERFAWSAVFQRVESIWRLRV
jgi:glycosyltransferase involved in cell wall biosynthesis